MVTGRVSDWDGDAWCNSWCISLESWQLAPKPFETKWNKTSQLKNKKWPQLEHLSEFCPCMLQLSCLSFRFFHVFSDFWNCRLRSWLCPLPSWHGWAQYETFAKLQGFTQRLLKMPAHGNPQGANVAMKFNNASAKGSTSCNFFGTCIFGMIFTNCDHILVILVTPSSLCHYLHHALLVQIRVNPSTSIDSAQVGQGQLAHVHQLTSDGTQPSTKRISIVS